MGGSPTPVIGDSYEARSATDVVFSTTDAMIARTGEDDADERLDDRPP